ncbi:MAG: hypothetical protein QF681_07435 [Vicinamibacterales bacterium]|jgi:hypothetical protein|nr:hypothetical protein [Vicinamibacterales bacterium]
MPPDVRATVSPSHSVARTAAGILLAGMLLVGIAGSVWPVVPALAPPLLAWCAFGLLGPKLGRPQRVQALVFVAVGAVALVWGISRGAELRVERILGQNQPILSMLAAITLLRLLNPPVGEAEPELPRGLGTYVRSMFGVHAFGAIINISAVIIMADRLARAAPLKMNQAQLLSRAFTAVAFFSPFIGGVALALAYTPGSNPLLLLTFGGPLALVALVLLTWYAHTGRVDDIENFRGYPVHFESLMVPLVLGTAVLLAYTLTSSYSVLSLITMLTPVIAGTALLVRDGPSRASRALKHYVTTRVPEMGGELALFLGAGVLGAGLVAVFSANGHWVPFETFDAGDASLLLLVFILTSLACIHPVVVVSVVVPLLQSIDPDPSFVAIAFAMGWGLGCAVNPMSGINLVLSTRYGASNWALGRNNVAFSATLYPVAVGLLFLYERTVG